MIVVTAATRWESEPLARLWGLSPSTPGLLRGEAAGRKVALVETGIGAEKTREALRRLGVEKVSVVLSAGLAGALQPGMRRGDIVLDLRGGPIERAEAARAIASRLGLALHMGAVASSERVLAAPAAKRALGLERRAAAVDMESAAVREWAASRGAEFLAVRVVLDELGDRLPEGVPEGDGPAELARYALARWKDIPLLLSLGLRQKRAMSSLARFLGELAPELR